MRKESEMEQRAEVGSVRGREDKGGELGEQRRELPTQESPLKEVSRV